MKKTLLISGLLLGSFFSVNAQVLVSENFNNLTAGNIGTNLTGAVGGQGEFLTINSTGGTNSDNSNYQVVTNDATHGNVVQIVGSNQATGGRTLRKPGIADLWANRVDGDILEVEYEFFTGPASTSKNAIRVLVYDSTGTKILCGFSFSLDTKIISGVAYYAPPAAAIGNYLFYLGDANTELVLPANTWVKVGTSFDLMTGEVKWKGPGVNGFVMAAGTGSEVRTVDMIVSTTTGNTVAGVGLFDNFVVRATFEDTLLSIDETKNVSNSFSVYPNPATNVVNIKSSVNASIQTVSITDLNGRTVKTNTVSGNEAQINISDLASGVYMMSINSDEGSVTKKIVKK